LRFDTRAGPGRTRGSAGLSENRFFTHRARGFAKRLRRERSWSGLGGGRAEAAPPSAGGGVLDSGAAGNGARESLTVLEIRPPKRVWRLTCSARKRAKVSAALVRHGHACRRRVLQIIVSADRAGRGHKSRDVLVSCHGLAARSPTYVLDKGPSLRARGGSSLLNLLSRR